MGDIDMLKNNEANKMSKNNWLEKQTNIEKAYYQDAVNELNKKYEIHRLKGLGEVSKDVMADTVCNESTRILQQVTVEDIDEMAKAFDVWMDKNVSDRKEYIEENLQSASVKDFACKKG